jgi:hypothetical protein
MDCGQTDRSDDMEGLCRILDSDFQQEKLVIPNRKN